MTVLNRNPQSVNFLQPTKFLLNFDRLPAVTYQCQQVNLPGATLGVVTRETPFLDIYSPGTKLVYNPLSVTFYIDEELESWKNMLTWFYSIADPSGFEKRDHEHELQTNKHLSDATLTILTNLNNPGIRIKFANIFPMDISDLQFDVQGSADTILTATVTFRYDYYTVENA
jgi:hypothetical protein